MELLRRTVLKGIIATLNRTPNVDSAGSKSEHILRNTRTPADARNLLQDPEMEDYLAAFRVTKLCQKRATVSPEDVAHSVPKEEEIEEKLDMSEHEYIPAS